ncbi:precorrin-3B synthase [Nakamurella sp. UYEF19]|uniref:hypothetical protein n=1 Tax=Nakamurella sp. UYEF19 TaxID=1756392 RepID=UPI003394EC05
MTTSPAARDLADRCPGLLRPHQAADGAVVRLRLPGGRIRAPALAGLQHAAASFGDGLVQMTSRGNLQLRGVSPDGEGEVPGALVDAVRAAGLIPSTTHELVRNIICSPLTGRIGGSADLRTLTDELDRLLCGTPALAGLSGRFLFALDDGRTDVTRISHDLGVRTVSTDRVRLVVGGLPGPIVVLASAARWLIELTLAFLRHREAAGLPVWHVRELPCGGAELLETVDILLENRVDIPDHPVNPSGFPPDDVHSSGFSPVRPGTMVQRDGRSMLSMAVPLGLLDARQVEAVTEAAAAGTGEIVVTPWRSLLVPDVQADVRAMASIETSLVTAGLDLDPRSGWLGLSACAGAPGCGRAAAPTGPTAASIARHPRTPGDLPIHVVACERRCGALSSDHVEVLVLPGTARLLRRAIDCSDRGDPCTVDVADPTSILTAITALARTGS